MADFGADPALAVPAKPASGLVASRCDPGEGRYPDRCPYSKSGFAWWEKRKHPANDCCTCEPIPLSEAQLRAVVSALPTRNGTFRVNTASRTLDAIRRAGLIKWGDLLNEHGETVRAIAGDNQ